MGRKFLWAVAAAAIFASRVAAADFTAKSIDKAPPKEIGDSIRAALQPRAIQVLDGGKAILELWLRQDVPLKSKPSSPSAGGDSIAETTLLGAVVVPEAGLRDYKDNEVPKGTFTARYALQPQDGDHLGTAEFNYFIALLPADADRDLNGISAFKPMVKTSGKLTSSGHPSILSLRPSAADAPATVTEPAAEHKAVRIVIPGAAAGAKANLGFDLVFQGHGHIQ